MQSAQHRLLTSLTSFLVAIALTATPSAHGQTNRLGWSADQAQAWQAMHASNHIYWQDLLGRANNPNNYAEEGIYDGLCYLITGDPAFAHAAWAHNSHLRGQTYNPGGELPISSNVIRHRFVHMSLLYSWIADELPPADKAAFRDIIELWIDMVTGVGEPNFGMVRMADSDEVIGNYFGIVLYALAIEADDPARSAEILGLCRTDPNGANFPYTTICIGGLDPTGTDRSSFRNTINEFGTQYFTGGHWIESSAYNLTTVRYLIQGVTAINDHLGEDKFPELTAVFDDLAKATIQRSTPDFTDLFQWGDMDAVHPHTYSLFHGLGFYGYVHHVTNDPFIAQRYHEFYDSYRPSGGNASMFMNLDPAAPQATPSGFTSHDAHGRGVGYWHEGWEQNDSFFASTMFNPTHVDHSFGSMSNFNLWRQGGWALLNPRGYNAYVTDMPYRNTLMVYGGIGRCHEAWGRIGYEAEPGYMYHIGTTGGQFQEQRYWIPPPETVHEYTRTQMLLHHDDGSDSVVVFDRLDTCGPIVGPGACITTEQYERHRVQVRNWIDAAQGKHQWVVHTPTDAITVNGDEFAWTAPNGETVKLTTFMDNVSHAVYDELAEYQTGGAPLYLQGWFADSELAHQLRLVPDATDPWMTMLNVLHVGSDATLMRLSSVAGPDIADGVLIQTGTARQGIIFNATQGTPPPPTAPVGSRAVHDPLRQAANAQLHFFKRGFTLSVPAGPATTLRIADLDPALSWTVELDGSGAVPLAVSGQGLAEIALGVLGAPASVMVTTPGGCLPDVNGDDSLTPTDFTAWVNAFNNNLPECDQNNDGMCTPTDFTAWIANFNAGCP